MNRMFLILMLLPTIIYAEKNQKSLGGVAQPGLSKTAYGLIRIIQDDGEYQCSGVLITPRHVLTAGHCVTSTFEEAPIYASQYNVRIAGGTYRVSQIDANPNFDPNSDANDDSSKYDVGILTLDRNVTKVAPIPLATKHPKVGEILYFYGYGTNAKRESNPLKRAAKGKIKVNRVADGVFGAVRRPVNKYATVCSGDSGGAVVRTIGKKSYVVGAVSSSTTDDDRFGGCRASASPDDDTYVDLISPTSQAFIRSVINR